MTPFFRDLLAGPPSALVVHYRWHGGEAARAMAPRLAPLGPVFLAAPCTEVIRAPGGGVDAAAAAALRGRLGRILGPWYAAGVAMVCPVTLGLTACAFSPEGELDALDGVFWGAAFRRLLHNSGALVVAPVPGWAASSGVSQEVAAMIARNRIVCLPPVSNVEG